MPSHRYQDTAQEFEKLLIFGAGGSGREVAWLASQVWGKRVEVQFVVDQPEFLSADVNGIHVASFDDIVRLVATRYVVAIGDPMHRRRIATLFERTLLPAATIVHPRVEMSDSVLLGQGTIVCAGTVLTTNIYIGNHVQVNVGCSISHDAVIGDFTTLSPGVHVAGHVQLGSGVFIGIGASVINGRSGKPLIIGDGAIIAAGACVTDDVPAGVMVAGVPAVKKR